MNSRFKRIPAEGKLMGVAAGLSELTGLDLLLVRLALVFALLVTGPIALLLYLGAGFLADAQ